MLSPNAAAADICAIASTIIWSTAIIPPIIVAYRTKTRDSHGLSPWCILLWALGALLYAPYSIIQDLHLPIIVQQHLFYVLTCITLVQCLRYAKSYSRIQASCVFAGLIVFFAVFDVGSIFAGRKAKATGFEGIVDAFEYGACLADVLGLLPQFVLIWRNKRVALVSIVFFIMDVVGCVCCILSLFLRPRLDVPAFVFYLSLCILDVGILVLAAILNPLASQRPAHDPRRSLDTMGDLPYSGETSDDNLGDSKEVQIDVAASVDDSKTDTIHTTTNQPPSDYA
ncbi:hypothetical protein M231_07797 [Tremella mesenterica]|uniref:Uncharacterized protein n=1 Tax=Tremella mesenterica TaxID=5217 RepID=A0A4Q1BFD4_TREME|nr:uncharacterized protein TREMEDRAFT_62573 [Tremella mesenterica DSM 1558]EIW69704.1 hypothetical protein TREMEDRAFT_62573 [Tremella mesenterica DSM 1558]RXK34951.1 hypothetical protein M231_07797 [Tremella mesenterica]